MKKLTKAALTERNALCDRISEAYELLESAVTDLNDSISIAWELVESRLAEYNEVIADANAWRESIAADIQSYIDERSEKWQESDRAAAYHSWRSEYEETIEEPEFEKPEELEFDIENAAELLAGTNEEINE